MNSSNIEAVLSMTPLQKGLVFHSAMHPSDSYYIEQVTFAVGFTLAPDILQRSLDYVTKRHQVLRTGFFWENVKSPVQVVLRTARIPVQHFDWSALSRDEQARRFQTLLEEDRARSFNLGRAPLLRATIVKLARNTCQFVLTFHHAILDGWSLNRLFREVWEVYRTLEAGQVPSLAPAPRYADFLSWLDSRDPEGARRYWIEALSGVSSPASLPILREPSPTGGRSVGHVLKDIPPGLSEQLQKLARSERVTLNAVFQVAWAILLSRLSGQDEALFGTIVSGRPSELDGVEDMIGLFINTIPMRISLPTGASVAESLHLAHEAALRHREFDYCSLSDIQSWTGVPNGTPMFETLFIFENIPGATKVGAGQAFAFERTNYPLTVLIAPAERISIKVLYEEARLSREGAQAVLEQFVSVCEEMVRDPALLVADVAPFTEAERRRQPPRDPISHPTLDVLWRNRVATTPNAVSVVDGACTLTVAELNDWATRIRGQLHNSGVRRGDVVAIRGIGGAELIAAMIAALTMGAAFLLVDPTYPEARQRQMLEAARPRYIIGSELNEIDIPVVASDNMARLKVTPPKLCPDDAAFLVFTSGSTGHPKAVVQTHRALSNRLTWAWEAYPFTAEDRSVQKTPLGFVDSIAEILVPVLGGSPLIIAPEDARRDPAALCELLATQKVTRLISVPSLLAGVLEYLDAAGQSLPDLHLVHSSGESLRIEILRSFAERLPHVTLLNLYGSSEVGADVTIHVCDLERLSDTIPIGTNILGIDIRLLDDRLRPVPVGAIGEVYVCGAGLARGYLDHPSETAARFLPDLTRSGQRMFRTGDLARWRPDGQLIFAGRADHQINLRGNRIEPEEIEALCAAQEGVTAAVAFSSDDGALTLALLSQIGRTPDIESIRTALKRQLPPYMWPDRIVKLERLAYLPNGKIDRAKVSALVGERSRTEQPELEPPQTEIEKQLAMIWGELLSIPEVSRTDNFFVLGGHSILAMQLASRVLKRTGVRLPLQVIFERPMLADMAAALAQHAPHAEAGRQRIQRSKRTLVNIEEPPM